MRTVRKYPPEIGETIAELYETYSNKEIAKILTKRFPELPPFTASKVNCFKKRHGLKSSRRILPKGGSKFPETLLPFMKEHVRGRSSAELAELIRQELGFTMTAAQVNCYKRNHSLPSGLNTRFRKGSAAHNKGLKQTDFMTPEQIEKTKKTRFKKGQMPHNHLEVGTVVVTSDGYLVKKIAEPKLWKPLHRLVWEEHYGPIPKDSIIVFLDGNPQNCDIGNLQMVTRAEHVRLNQRHLRFSDPELTKTGINIAKLTNAAGDKRREKK